VPTTPAPSNRKADLSEPQPVFVRTKHVPEVCLQSRLTRSALVLLLGHFVSSAQAQSAATLKVETHLVETTLSVHDLKGKAVGDLDQASFTIAEDGVPQKIRYFARNRELPLSIGILVDESGSQDKFVKEHEKAIESFLHEVMEPADRAFAICFGNHLRLTSDWTSDGGALLSGIREFDKGSRNFPEVGPVEDRELGTALNDAVYFSVQEKLASQSGRRKVLLIFSDGQENSSEHDLVNAIEEAQNENVLVYAIRTTENKPAKTNARDRYGIRELQHLTAATGGTDFDAGTTNVKEDFAEIAADLRLLYEVGYYSTNKRRDGSFRKVTVTVDREDLKVRARTGYTAR
jgi:Ca-activated chloride channel homolog